MRILDQLERKYGRHGIPNVTAGLIFLQVVAYVLSISRLEILQGLYLKPRLVLEGQIWRLLTFLAVPPITNAIFFAFLFWYLFYLMGTALENHWGTFRYNIYLLIGYIATVAVSFLVPDSLSTNLFWQGSVFLAFAFLYPDFVMYIFFILPVKIKWLALLTWIGYFYTLIFGSRPSRLLVLASICSFLLFFASDIRERIKTGKRHMEFQAKRIAQHSKKEAFHRCVVCGVTDITNPEMDFRYCPECKDTPGYCSEHLPNHQHIT
ncbi:hypothetical protein L0222_26405 [bacterium]|nr:hypothetical protein [bacterium]